MRSLERQADSRFEVLILPDGTQVRHGQGEMLDALSASLHGRGHWLLPPVRETGTNEGMPGLVRQLESSRERVENESKG